MSGKYKGNRYRYIRVNGEFTPVHRVLAAKVLGRAIPTNVHVHHHNGNGFDNGNGNLVICENHSYHMLLHQRERVLKAGFDPNKFKWCQSCGKHKLKTEFHVCRRRADGLDGRCKMCYVEKYQDRKKRGVA